MIVLPVLLGTDNSRFVRLVSEEEEDALDFKSPSLAGGADFVPVGDISADLDSRLREKINGKVKSAALRAIVNDPGLRDVPAYRDAVASGDPIAGMEMVDSIYIEKE